MNFENSMARILAAILPCASVAIAQDVPQSAAWYQPNWEQEKLEKGIVTDTIYIHHSALTPGLTPETLSDFHRERLYRPIYTSPSQNDPPVKGEPYSGHFRLINGRLVQVFYGYHWIVRADGSMESLLNEDEVGWHAGSWNENQRSIAILLDGDFSQKEPPKKMLETIARLIRAYSRLHPITRLRAHYDNNRADRPPERNTVCPGAWFDAKDRKGLTGRDRLMKMAKVSLSRD